MSRRTHCEDPIRAFGVLRPKIRGLTEMYGKCINVRPQKRELGTAFLSRPYSPKCHTFNIRGLTYIISYFHFFHLVNIKYTWLMHFKSINIAFSPISFFSFIFNFWTADVCESSNRTTGTFKKRDLHGSLQRTMSRFIFWWMVWAACFMRVKSLYII